MTNCALPFFDGPVLKAPPEKLAVPKDSGSGMLGSAANAAASSSPYGTAFMTSKNACSQQEVS